MINQFLLLTPVKSIRSYYQPIVTKNATYGSSFMGTWAETPGITLTQYPDPLEITMDLSCTWGRGGKSTISVPYSQYSLGVWGNGKVVPIFTFPDKISTGKYVQLTLQCVTSNNSNTLAYYPSVYSSPLTLGINSSYGAVLGNIDNYSNIVKGDIYIKWFNDQYYHVKLIEDWP